MFKWTFKGLLAEPVHLFSSASAVGAAFALVLFFEAVFAGESKQIVEYIQRTDPTVWVMQKGVSNMHMASSFVWDWKAGSVEAVDGVSKVTPILYLNTVMVAGERNWFTFVVGLRDGDGRAGPWAITAGASLPGPGEAIVPAVLARLADLNLGDKIAIAGRQFTIAGLSEDTFSMANSVTFVTLNDLSDIMSAFGSFSYFLVDAEPGVDAADLAARIRDEVEKVNALPNEAFVKSDWSLAMQMGLEIVGLMTIIGGALAILLTGFTVSSFVRRKRRELAVMKALGVRNGPIYVSIMAQAACIALLGFVIATIIVFLAVPATAAFVPQVTLSVRPEALLKIGATALVVAVVAAVAPARSVMRVDPVLAFKE
jgi:putative ABC transport system permease protein